MRHTSTPEQPNLEELIQKTIQRFSLPDRPLQTSMTTASGPRNLLREMKKELELCYAYCASQDFTQIEREEADPDLNVVYTKTNDDEQHFDDSRANLRILAHELAAGNMARLHHRKKNPMNLATITGEASTRITLQHFDQPHGYITQHLSHETPGENIWYYFAYQPFLYQVLHSVYFEYFLQGGTMKTLIEESKNMGTVPEVTFVPPAHHNLEIADILHYVYDNTVEGIREFTVKIAPHISEEDRQKERAHEAELRERLSKIKAPYDGYIDQEIALDRLATQRRLEDLHRKLGAILINSCIYGDSLLDLRYTNPDTTGNLVFDLTNAISRSNKESDTSRGVMPFLEISTGKNSTGPIHDPTFVQKIPTESRVLTDSHVYTLFYLYKSDLMPTQVKQGKILDMDAQYQVPIYSIYDLARGHEGGLAWTERVFLPALEAITSMYLEAETFENSEDFAEQLDEAALHVLAPDTEQQSTPDAPVVPTYTWKGYTPKDKPQEERGSEIPDLLYDHARRRVYYLRPSTVGISAGDDSRDLYRQLTGQEIPENTVLREIPYQRSAVTWKQVETVLLQHFPLHMDRQAGSHMQYIRTIETPDGPRDLRATIQAHYQDRAKLKTLASVLDSLRIPEALFWILLSKTYKLARLNKEELNRFSGHLAQRINTTTEI